MCVCVCVVEQSVLSVLSAASCEILHSNPSLPPSTHPPSGGNDVMSVKDSCLVYDARCEQQITEAMAILEGLLETMHNDGIQHVIFMG